MEDHKLSLYDNIAKVNAVDPELYERYPVKRGLRNSDGWRNRGRYEYL